MGLDTDPRMSWLTMCVIFWTSLSLAAAANTTSPSSASNANQTLWPDYALDANRNTGALYLPIPLTYFDCVTEVIAVNINGFVSFGAEYFDTLPPPSKWPFALKILAVYWTDREKYNTDLLSKVYINQDSTRLRNVTNESSLVKYAKQVIAQPEFEPLLVLAVTWVDVRPKLRDKFPNDTATFQLIIATDSQVTYAIRAYQQVWKSPELGALTYYSAAYSMGKGDRLKIGTAGNLTAPEVILLGTKAPNKDPYTCVGQAIAANTLLNSSLYALPSCPCFLKQASIDEQFTTATAAPRCYQSKTLPAGSTLLQLCCYNEFGVLVNLTKEARVPVSADPNDRSLQAAYEKCCADGSNLCRWFLLNVHRPLCVNNMTLLNTMELPAFPSSTKEFTYMVSPSKATNYQNHFGNPGMDPIPISVSTVFNSSHGFSLTSDGFSWYFSVGLQEVRKLPYPQQMIFYITDANNISTPYAPLIKLCLCEQVEQCNDLSFPVRLDYPQFERSGFIGLDRYEKGNVNMMLCNCKGNGTGRYCEKPINPCDDCLIQQKIVCNTIPKDYCPSCPLGYSRDGTQCRESSGSDRIIPTSHLFLFITVGFIWASVPWL